MAVDERIYKSVIAAMIKRYVKNDPKLIMEKLAMEWIAMEIYREFQMDEPKYKTGMGLQHIERLFIEQTLQCFDGNKSKAAIALGINRKTLHNKLKTLHSSDP